MASGASGWPRSTPTAIRLAATPLTAATSTGLAAASGATLTGLATLRGVAACTATRAGSPRPTTQSNASAGPADVLLEQPATGGSCQKPNPEREARKKSHHGERLLDITLPRSSENQHSWRDQSAHDGNLLSFTYEWHGAVISVQECRTLRAADGTVTDQVRNADGSWTTISFGPKIEAGGTGSGTTQHAYDDARPEWSGTP